MDKGTAESKGQMMSDGMVEFNPVSRISVGAIGRPGERVFYLQASLQDRAISLRLEKEQVAALAKGIDAIIEELQQREVWTGSTHEEVSEADLEIDEYLEPTMLVAQIGLAFDQNASMMVLVVQGLSMDEEASETMARLWASPTQMSALSKHAKEVVSKGRPTCSLCQRPIDPEGHFCPRRNGHGSRSTVGA